MGDVKLSAGAPARLKQSVPELGGREFGFALAALFPGAMAIMAGIDLLAKCWSGDDTVGKTGSRFKGFLKEYFGLDVAFASEHGESIYQLRNALLHNFGLSSRSGSGREYKFVVTEDQMDLIWIVHRNPPVWHVWIDLRVLRQRFEDAIELNRRDLGCDADLRKMPVPMLKRYGIIRVGAVREPRLQHGVRLICCAL